jgi:hypothetical protein
LRNSCKAVVVCLLGVTLALGSGCGRKLPPLPPGQGDPVEIEAIDFIDDGSVEARAGISIPGGRVILLGKPKGLCPSCTDDLTRRDEKTAEQKGGIVLKDPKPEADYMVYRLLFEKGTVSFMTGARVVRKD